MMDAIIASAVLQSPTESYVSLPRARREVQSLHLQQQQNEDDYHPAAPGCTTSGRLLPVWYTRALEMTDVLFSCCRMSDVVMYDCDDNNEPCEMDYTIPRSNSVVDEAIYNKRISSSSAMPRKSVDTFSPFDLQQQAEPPRKVSTSTSTSTSSRDSIDQDHHALTKPSQQAGHTTGFLFVDRTPLDSKQQQQQQQPTTRKYFPPPTLHHAHPLTSNHSCATTATTASICSDGYSSVWSFNSLPTKVTLMTEDDRSEFSARPSEVTVPCSNMEWRDHAATATTTGRGSSTMMMMQQQQQPSPPSRPSGAPSSYSSSSSSLLLLRESHSLRRTFTDPDMAEQVNCRQLQSETTTTLMELNRRLRATTSKV